MVRRWQTRSLSHKVLVGFAVVLVAIAALGWSSLDAISRMGSMLDDASRIAARKLEVAGEIRSGFQEMSNQAKKAQLAHVIHNFERVQAGRKSAEVSTCSACHTISPVEEDLRQFEALDARMDRLIAQARPLANDQAGRAALDQLSGGVENWGRLYREYLSKAGGDFAAAHDIITEQMLPILTGIEKSTKTLTDQAQEFLTASNQRARRTVVQGRWTALILAALCVSAVILVSFVVRGACRRLKGLATEVAERAVQVSSTAERVSSSSQELSRGVTEQVQSLTTISAASLEINSTARQNAENSRNSTEFSGQVHQRLTQAGARLDELMAAMRAIEESSSKVGRILKVIDEIAFQTNLLALNAAVEAARAGQSGLGFAVVADEVRNLARRSAEAAKETAALVQESLTASQNGKSKVAEVSQAFLSITQSADSLAELAGRVQAGSQDQALRIDEISQRIRQMQSVTEGASTSASDGASAAENLTENALELQQIVEKIGAIGGAGET